MFSSAVSKFYNLVGSTYSYLPNFPAGWRLSTPKEVISKAQTVALGAMALVVLSNTQPAEAGPLTFAGCMAICLAATAGAFAPACAAACATAIAVPAP